MVPTFLSGIVLSYMVARNRTAMFRKALMLSILLLLPGCIPVPTIPHGLGVVPDKETFESLQSGQATRADVLLLLGEPKERLSDDRFLMYEWDVVYGWVIVGGPYQAIPVPVGAPHYFCLEFGSDSTLVRREQLTGSVYGKLNETIPRCMNGPER
jgi:hypothetical protein